MVHATAFTPRLFGASAAALVALLPASAVGQDAQAELNQIVNQWRQTQSTTQSVRYIAVGKVLTPKGKFTGSPELPKSVKGDVPAEDHVSEDTLSWTIDFERNRVRTEWRHSVFFLPLGKFVPAFDVRLCDGTVMKKHTPREENTSKDYKPSKHQPDLWTESNDHTVFFQPFEYPVLLAHGVSSLESPDPRRLRKPIQSGDYRLHGRGIHNGRECRILRAGSKDPRVYQEFWVDRERSGAILRWYYFSQDRPYLHTAIDYQRYEGGWRPEHWVTTIYDTTTGAVDASHDVRVTEFSWNPRLESVAFDMVPTPNMVVHDAKKSKIYRVERDLTQTELPWIAGDADDEEGHGIVFWVSVIVLILLACGILYASWRRFGTNTIR